MRKTIFTSAALLAGLLTSSAAVTVQGWWHLDSTEPIIDSSGNGRNFRFAFWLHPNTKGHVNALLFNNGAGGPLGSSGWTSTNCIQIGDNRVNILWDIGYNPPTQDFGIEIWVLPKGTGIVGSYISGGIFSSGASGGVALRINNPSYSHDFDGTQYIDAFDMGTGGTIGGQVIIDTNKWMHLAIVNVGGTTTFYTNGIACGDSVSGVTSASAGAVYMMSDPFGNAGWAGYLDEARMFTFASGAFSTNDLLLRPNGPMIISQSPANVYVWNLGAVPFRVNASFDSSLQYQWRRGGTNLGGAIQSSYFLPLAVTPWDSGSTFDCIMTSDSFDVASSPSTLTVVSVNIYNVVAYRFAVGNESSLKAYFPVDDDMGTTLQNVTDGTHNGALELAATYDGRTNTSFGWRALSLNADGDVQIPNNSAFEFASGFGTIEALVDLSQASQPPFSDPTIFAEAYDNGDGTFRGYYAVRASANGKSLLYDNFNGADRELNWAVPGGGLLGKLSHVAVVVDNLTNVTAYVNGENLGTKTQTGFGPGVGAPAWIGAMATSRTANRWAGTIDELAVYGSALSEDTIQGHYSTFVYGTNTPAPSIVSAPAARTVFAGASPTLLVQAAGTLPLEYQWTANSTTIPGATSPRLAVSDITVTTTYGLKVQNAYGSTNIAVVVTVAAPPAGYVATVMTDHPTALWRLSDTSSQPVLDSAGFNDGVYSASGVTHGATSIPGEAGTAASFDGSAGRAVVPYTPVLNPSGPLTVEFWAKLSGYGFYVPVSSMNRPARDGGYEFYLDGNSPGYEWHNAPGPSYNWLTTDTYTALTADFTAPTVGAWYHVAGIYDGTNYLLYINGEPAGRYIDNYDLEGQPHDFVTGVVEGGLLLPQSNLVKGFYIGSSSDNGNFFKGTMADVAFYNYALTQDQLRKHVFAGLASPISMALASTPGVVADTKPFGARHSGINGPLGTNAATWVASSVDIRARSGVMQFSGTVGNQIVLPANPDFDSPVGTIMFWMKSAGTVPPGNEGATLFDRKYNFPNFGSAGEVIIQNDHGYIEIWPQYSGAGVLSNFFLGPSYEGQTVIGKILVNDGLWHHVAYVYDQSTTGSITVYVDGAQAFLGTYKNSQGWAWPAQQEIELGQSHDPYWKRFDGQMDDFRFYGRILTETEIASVFNFDSVVDTAALKVRFNFDAAPGPGLAVSWSPSVAVPQTAGAVTDPFVDLPTGRTPLLVPQSTAEGFFRARSP